MYSIEPRVILILSLLLIVPVAYAQEQEVRSPPIRPLPSLSASVRVKGLPASRTAVPLKKDRQVFHDLAHVPWIEDVVGIRRKTVSGETVRFSILRLDPEKALHGTILRVPYERVLLQLNGSLHLDVDGNRISLTPMQVAVIPANVPHAMTRPTGTETVLALEFSTARRAIPDSIPISLEKPARSKENGVVDDFNRLLWTVRSNGIRVKRVEGDSSYFNLWYFPASTMKGTDRPGHHHTAEQISYVLHGHAEMRVGDRIRAVAPGSLLMIPSNVDHLPMTPIDNEEILLLDFQPIIRSTTRVPFGKRE